MLVHFMNKVHTIPQPDKDTPLYEILSALPEIKLHVPCGGHGVCKKCTALVIPADDSTDIKSLELSPEEQKNLHNSTHFSEISANSTQIPTKNPVPVLICQTNARGISEVYLPDYIELTADSTLSGIEVNHKSGFSPLSIAVEIELPHLTTDNKNSTEEILREILLSSEEVHKLAENQHPSISFPRDILSQVSRAMHEEKARISLILSRTYPQDSPASSAHITAVKVQDSPQTPPIGLAVDIGTTTVCATLVDLSNGTVLSSRVFENPQRKYGADVISRMSYSAESPTGITDLMFCIRNSIYNNICSLLDEINQNSGTDYTPDSITYCTIAGNSVMEHMFAGIDTTAISTAPFTLPARFGSSTKSDSCRTSNGKTFTHHNAPIYLAPLPASYVGGDISFGAAYILTSKPKLDSTNAIFLDLGTNGEICVIRNRDSMCNFTKRFYLAATAAGPALEGANIKFGIPAVEGAIFSVALDKENGTFDLKTIADAPPKGICGSGIISATAAVLDTGLVTEYGRICDDGEPESEDFTNIYSAFEQNLSESDSGKLAVNLSGFPLIQLTDADIRQIQTAKAAIAAGTSVLINHSKLTFSSVDKIYLAGSFGGGINPASAARIGLLPQINGKTASITEAVGNTSAKGAVEFMINSDFRRNLNDFMANSTYIELSSDPSFTEHFVNEMLFPDA